MGDNHYRHRLIEAVKELAEIRETIFLSIFNLAMAGELKEWNDSVEIGEVYEFSTEIFEGCADINIQLLTKLMSNIEDVYASLNNLNNISN